MSKQITILNTKILPGKTYTLSLDIARLHTRTKLDVPIIISRAKKSGPCLLITAGIHGNEINGIEIVRQLVANKYHIPDAGTIICVPVLNVFGFIIQRREFPDGRDLNRVFPGTKGGSLGSRFAYAFMKEILPHADYCIDYHTGGASRFNFSQIRVDDNDHEALEMAKAFGTKFIKISSHRENSYRESAAKLGKKILLFEGGKSLDLNKSVTKSGVSGALRLMDHLGVKTVDLSAIEDNFYDSPILFKESKWIRAAASGMYRSLLKNGSKVRKGQVIGAISDPFGSFERKLKAPVAGYIICSNHSPIVNQGDALCHIAIVDE